MPTTILNYKQNHIIPTVQNMTSPRSGNPVANQFIINLNNGVEVFQSYKSIIAIKNYGRKDGEPLVVLDENTWKYSMTTSKYRNEFLRETTKETQAKIDSGEYALAELN